MEQKIKNYEIGFLTVNEDEIKDVLKELGAHKGEILNQGKPRKIRLAYAIEKQEVAFFTFIQFTMDASMIESFSAKIKLNPKVLRFMVINLPAIALRKEREAERPSEQPERPEKAELKAKASDEEPKKASSDDFVDNELLEKKLEEILK